MKNEARRSGRTKLILAQAINQLLETGQVTISDHYHSNHTDSFYKSFVERPMFRTLSALLELPTPEVYKIFEVQYNYNDRGRVGSITVTANNSGLFQY